MEFKFILGVDISKEWFNFCLMSKNFEIIWEGEVENNEDAILLFFAELMKLEEINDINDIILVLEYTGIYVQNLVRVWLSKTARVSLVDATKVSEYLGGSRGWDEKTDPIDARRLAKYGLRYTDKLVFHQAKRESLVKLQSYQRQRERINKVINLLSVPANESDGFDTAEITEEIKHNQAASMKALKMDLKNLEQKLNAIIDQDPELKQMFKLITSVDGVGAVTAREVIITTSAFTDFTPQQAKAFARYAGVTPMFKQSGKIKKKARTSKRANKKIKTLLTMGATSLINTKSELALFYHRKIREGKPHFSVINAMRNKLILRIFAVIRNQTIYQKNLNICLE